MSDSRIGCSRVFVITCVITGDDNLCVCVMTGDGNLCVCVMTGDGNLCVCVMTGDGNLCVRAKQCFLFRIGRDREFISLPL